MIGASPQRLSIGHRIVENLLAYRFPGAVYPVHPTAESVCGLRALRGVEEIPDGVDLAHIVVASGKVLAQLEACAERGIRAVIVNSSGFREIGGDGEELERRLARRARELGVRVFGPNCQGVISTDAACPLYANFTYARVRPGGVSVLAQGGGVGEVIDNELQERGVGLRMYASNGNACDVSVPEVLAYFAADEGTRVIVLHVESVPDPRALIEAARSGGAAKPVLALKAGATREGARAVASHTGGLLEDDARTDLVFGSAGAIRFTTVSELCDAARAYATQPAARGRRLAVLTNAGSPAICATDEAVRRGLALPEPSPAAKRALAAALPPASSLRNPVDMTATAGAAEYGASVRALLADPGYDALLVCFITPFFVDCEAAAREIAAASSGAAIPVVANVMASPEMPEVRRILERGGIPTYEFPEAAASVVAALTRGGERRTPAGAGPVALSGIAAERGRKAVAAALSRGGGMLEPGEAMALSSAYGIPVPDWEAARTPEEAGAAADRIGYPVVLKAVLPELVHKSEEGAVRMGLRDRESAVAEAWALAERFAGRAPTLFVQRQASSGTELLVGASALPGLGHAVAFGLGGVFVEALGDVVFRLAPLSREDASGMPGAIRNSAVLEGVRGKPAVDREALADLLLRVSRLVTDIPEIREIDLNPVIAGPAGQALVAVDVRVRVGEPR